MNDIDRDCERALERASLELQGWLSEQIDTPVRLNDQRTRQVIHALYCAVVVRLKRDLDAVNEEEKAAHG
jgi:hypothetical protein